jgi:NADPH:quinone reductase-like Zn-dependent oxidoreductase
MKAAVVTRYGPPDVLEIRDVPPPVPRDNEVLVRVHASSVCYGDRIIRKGPLFVRLMSGAFRAPSSPSARRWRAWRLAMRSCASRPSSLVRECWCTAARAKRAFRAACARSCPVAAICSSGSRAASSRFSRRSWRGAWAHLRRRAVFVVGAAAPVQADLEFLKTLIEAGQLRSVVSRTYALDDIVEAHRHADTDHKVGNIVVVIP